MQNLKLPITIDPYKSAQRRLECEGYFDVSAMERLLSVCSTDSQQVFVKVNFNVDELGLVVITGSATLNVDLTCQRCNGLLPYDLNAKFAFTPLKKAQDEADLPSYYDGIELDENGEVHLRELVEDELMLAIPLIPRHAPEDCEAEADSVWGELPEELDKPNPFDVLKQLK
ncbi:23S rRNA accumulation protein YceD [Thalassotalea agarivorans]|uniref:Large ribosomal RNA subunit accumulation protein YceD n=1 Tax=Thalassotalea agarivorans TaxID=349064 RepID=A0A1I0ET93_THASX|nr:23S rRNA accumulation protein YceD [Thalassotalea agarivorans]SET48767.1 uncharacterized protein SAMN05660429_01933 [Thalassotalea agarivorans]